MHKLININISHRLANVDESWMICTCWEVKSFLFFFNKLLGLFIPSHQINDKLEKRNVLVNAKVYAMSIILFKILPEFGYFFKKMRIPPTCAKKNAVGSLLYVSNWSAKTDGMNQGTWAGCSGKFQDTCVLRNVTRSFCFVFVQLNFALFSSALIYRLSITYTMLK